MWFVYLLKAKDKNWYYVGSTNDLSRRVAEHENGRVASTKAYRPLELVYKTEFDSEAGARQYELKVKKKRVEKEKIIRSLK